MLLYIHIKRKQLTYMGNKKKFSRIKKTGYTRWEWVFKIYLFQYKIKNTQYSDYSLFSTIIIQKKWIHLMDHNLFSTVFKWKLLNWKSCERWTFQWILDRFQFCWGTWLNQFPATSHSRRQVAAGFLIRHCHTLEV